MDERRVISPDGNLELRVFVAPQPDTELSRIAYRVLYKRKALIETSLLGVDIWDQEPLLGENVGLLATDDEKPAAYHSLTVHYMQNGSLGRLLDVEVRVWNNAVAFRYRIPQSAPLRQVQIADETTEFDVLHREKAAPALPFVTEVPDVAWVALTEAQKPDFPQMHLDQDDDGVLRVRLERRKDAVPDVAYQGQTPLTMPWRVIFVNPDKSRLIDVPLLTALRAAD
jgi:hypothetical protein